MNRAKRAPLSPAVFLDRDGTIIDDVHYIARPELVRLRPGAARAIGRLNGANVPVIIVTNQSGIARGLLTESDFAQVQARVAELLAAEPDGAGAHVDGTYMCPHHPDFTGPCDCRKPGTLLFRRAADEHGLDLSRSTFIGDRWRDVAPALAVGGRGMLIADSSTPEREQRQAEGAGLEVVGTLADAVDRVLSFEV